MSVIWIYNSSHNIISCPKWICWLLWISIINALQVRVHFIPSIRIGMQGCVYVAHFNTFLLDTFSTIWYLDIFHTFKNKHSSTLIILGIHTTCVPMRHRLLSPFHLVTSWVDITTTNTIGYNVIHARIRFFCFELVSVHEII